MLLRTPHLAQRLSHHKKERPDLTGRSFSFRRLGIINVDIGEINCGVYTAQAHALAVITGRLGTAKYR